jgi:DNA mismatch endonuclease (patch repair protein)
MCSKGRAPKSRLDYWGPKLEANRARDERARRELAALGWEVLTIWQCEIKDANFLQWRLTAFLEEQPTRRSTG